MQPDLMHSSERDLKLEHFGRGGIPRRPFSATNMSSRHSSAKSYGCSIYGLSSAGCPWAHSHHSEHWDSGTLTGSVATKPARTGQVHAIHTLSPSLASGTPVCLPLLCPMHPLKTPASAPLCTMPTSPHRTNGRTEEHKEGKMEGIPFPPLALCGNPVSACWPC